MSTGTRRRGGRPIRAASAWAVLVLAAAGCTSGSGSGAAAAPGGLASLERVDVTVGPEATRQISGLHGGEVSAEEDLVATYRGEAGSAILYLSVFADTTTALQQLARMHRGIAAGGTPFFHLSALTLRGGRVNLTLGMDQAHYFYASGRSVLWLTVTPGIASETLGSLMDRYPPEEAAGPSAAGDDPVGY